MVDLEANVVEECRLGQGLLGDRGGLMCGHPPAQKMKQIVRITAKGGLGHATDLLLVQISIGPIHFPASLLDHSKRAVGVAQSTLLNYTESHGQASSNRR